MNMPTLITIFHAGKETTLKELLQYVVGRRDTTLLNTKRWQFEPATLPIGIKITVGRFLEVQNYFDVLIYLLTL